MLLRRRRRELPPLAEDDVRRRSYGERSEDVTNVKPVVEQEEPKRQGRISDRGLRAAFRTRLDRRDES